MSLSTLTSLPSLTARVHELREKIECFRVVAPSDKAAVYRLRYDCYLQEGAILSRADSQLYDEFDEQDKAMVFAFRHGGILVASIRLHVLSGAHFDSPTMRTFSDVLLPHVNAGHTLIDPTRFVVNRDASRRFPELVYLALRLPFMAADYFGADLAVAAVRAEHMPFYRRVLRYSKVSEPRRYLQLVKPLGLMIAAFPRERPNVVERHPFFLSMPNESRQLFGRV